MVKYTPHCKHLRELCMYLENSLENYLWATKISAFFGPVKRILVKKYCVVTSSEERIHSTGSQWHKETKPRNTNCQGPAQAHFGADFGSVLTYLSNQKLNRRKEKNREKHRNNWVKNSLPTTKQPKKKYFFSFVRHPLVLQLRQWAMIFP